MKDATILVLMTDDVERLRMEQILRHADYEVISVSTVADASERLVAEPVDLFVCEYDRSEDERVALLTAAKWRLPNLARLLLIDEAHSRIGQKALETGIAHFALVPPVQANVLLFTAHDLLQWVDELRLGTPAPQTGKNEALRRRQLRESVEESLAQNRGPKETKEIEDTEEIKETKEIEETSTAAVSGIRGRVEWYY